MEWTGARYADAPTVGARIWIDAPADRIWPLVSGKPGAASGVGGVDRGVLGVRASVDRAAECLGPEPRQGSGISAVDAQADDRRGHEHSFLSAPRGRAREGEPPSTISGAIVAGGTDQARAVGCEEAGIHGR